MRVYHCTYHGDNILDEGFRDAEGDYGTGRLHRGVWVSDCPLDENEGADGDTYLLLNVPQERLVEYEWIEEGKGHREFLVPADLLNEYGPPEVWELPECMTCCVTLEDGSVCMKPAVLIDPERYKGWCEQHADAASDAAIAKLPPLPR